MEEPLLPRISAQRAQEVIERYAIELDPEALALLDGASPPAAYLRLLLENNFHAAALSFLAHALTKREAVWWVCLCLHSVYGDKIAEDPALKAAEAWSRGPGDENRIAAQAAAEAGSMDGAASFVAMAVFFSGGSIAPPECDAVAPADNLTGRLLTVALELAALAEGPAQMAVKQRMFLAKGIEIARQPAQSA